MNILRGAALTTGNAFTKPSPLDLYLESSTKTQTLRLFIEIDKNITRNPLNPLMIPS